MTPSRFEWERALRDADDVPWHVKAIALLVGTYMSADGQDARPSAASLARSAGLSRASVFRLLAEAETAGWLRSVARSGKVTYRYPQIPTDPSYQQDGSHSWDGSHPQDPSHQQDGSTSDRGLTDETRGSYQRDGRGLTGETQQSQDNHKTTQSPRARAAGDLAAEVGVSEEEIEDLIAKITVERPDLRSPVAYLRTLHRNGDLTALLAESKSKRQQTTIAAELERARADPALICPCGRAGGLHRRSDTGRLACAACARDEDQPPSNVVPLSKTNGATIR